MAGARTHYGTIGGSLRLPRPEDVRTCDRATTLEHYIHDGRCSTTPVPLRQMRSFRKVHAAGGKFALLEKAVVEESLLENVRGLLSTGIMLLFDPPFQFY